MLKTRPVLKETAKTLAQANPMLRRQMLVYQILGLVFSTVIAFTLGNPVMEHVNTVLEMVVNSGYTLSQQALVVQRMLVSVAGRMSMAILAQMAWSMVTVNLRFGIFTSIRKVAAGEGPAQLSDLANGFPIFGRVVWMHVLVNLFILGRTLLYVIPVALMIGVLGAVPGFYEVAVLSGFVATIACTCFLVAMTYRYMLAEYILAENPSFTARQAIREAVACSKGRIKQLLTFDLSFFGWACVFLAVDFALGKIFGLMLPEIAPYIVAVILLPAYVWFHTYVYTAFTLYFRNIVGLDRQEPSAPPPYSGGTGGSYSGPDIQI